MQPAAWNTSHTKTQQRAHHHGCQTSVPQLAARSVRKTRISRDEWGPGRMGGRGRRIPAVRCSLAPRECHDPPLPFHVAQRGRGGRGIPVVLGKSYARGNTTTSAPWFSRPPWSLLKERLGVLLPSRPGCLGLANQHSARQNGKLPHMALLTHLQFSSTPKVPGRWKASRRRLTNLFSHDREYFSAATLAEPRGEKKVQILGGEKLLEKCRWQCLSSVRGA